MRRLLIGFASAVAVIFVLTSLRGHNDVPTGAWNGKTTQGLPIGFVVTERHGTLFIDEWHLVFELRCEKTGRKVRVQMWSSIPAEVEKKTGRWDLDTRFLDAWERFRGGFVSDAEARGALDIVFAALDGDDMRKLATEKCTLFDLGFTARPGGEPPALPSDLQVRIDRDGTIATRVTAPPRPARR